MEASSTRRREVCPRREDSRLILLISSRMGSRFKPGSFTMRFEKETGDMARLGNEIFPNVCEQTDPWIEIISGSEKELSQEV